MSDTHRFRKLQVAIQAAVMGLFLMARQPVGASNTTPSWVQEVAATPAGRVSPKSAAVVLLQEQRVSVTAEGKTLTSERKAIRVLNREGRAEAFAAVNYLKGNGKVTGMRAWLLAPGGFVKAFGKDKVIDAATFNDDFYDEYRMQAIQAEDAEVGSVFAYEAEVEEKTIFSQQLWRFQDRWPCVLSRFILTLPVGWTAQAVTFNHEPAAPVVENSTYTWELRNLPFIEQEPAAPEIAGLAPELAVSFFPPDGAKTVFSTGMRSWREVSEWLTGLGAGQEEATEEMAAKARQLTANSKTEFEKIQALEGYVQSIRYVSIQTGLARGGGYRPHPAQAVFQKQYGDCKDKANLLRALLKTAGISSYLVAIYLGDRTHVRENWPSPMQFNHAVLAARINDTTQAMAVITHPELGRLLILDPTDSNTSAGDLPDPEQGSLALVEAGAKGALLRMPVSAPEANRVDLSIEAVLDEKGGLQAAIEEVSLGQAAVSRRAMRSAPESAKGLERWLSASAKGAEVSKTEAEDHFSQSEFRLRVNFIARNYGQAIQNKLLMFKPFLVSRRGEPLEESDERLSPILLSPRKYHEQVRVKLPNGFEIDEMPQGDSIETAFGKYSSGFAAQAGELAFSQELELRSATLPPAEFKSVKAFLDRVAASEQATVVLVRKSP